MKNNIDIYIDIIVRNPEGKITSHRRFKAKSLVQAYFYFLAAHFNNTNTYQIQDTSNTLQTVNTAAKSLMSAAALITNSLFGIVVGTGTNAVQGTDYALQTQIAHGVGAGQLQYAAESFTAPNATATLVNFTHSRLFTNSSGGSITITEVALYIIWSGSNVYFCFDRSIVPAGGQLVVNGGTATVVYTFKKSY